VNNGAARLPLITTPVENRWPRSQQSAIILAMAVAGRIPAERRVWFSDPRTPQRRMSVSTHASTGIAVISLWQGQTCTSTFRLPLTEASRMIAVLADGMAAGLVEPAATGADPPSRPWKAFLRRLRREFPWPPGSTQTGLRVLK
jgi:hypothetical protein